MARRSSNMTCKTTDHSQSSLFHTPASTMGQYQSTIPFLFLLYLLFFPLLTEAVGICWGTTSSHPLPPSNVVQNLLLPNRIARVRLFDADPQVLQSLVGTGIGVALGIPNEMLVGFNSSLKAATNWVHDNVTRYIAGGGVRIEYIFVGDEPFLLSYGQQFQPYVVGAATNIQTALKEAKLTNQVKVVVPCGTDVYQSNSTLPSEGQLRHDLNNTMSQLLSFLDKHDSPFVINLNPFLMVEQDKNFTLQHALFKPTSHPITDGRKKYENLFDLSIDTLVTALAKSGFANMDIMVGKVGWPTDGSMNASTSMAQTFMKGLVDHLQSNVGTPLRPKKFPTGTYIFSLLDEDRRSIANASNFERHWGVFTFDGQAKYSVDLGQGTKNLVNAQNVEYLALRWCVLDNNKDTPNASSVALNACSQVDCSVLSLGGSCSNVGWPGNVSYAFNSYYQQHDQRVDSCDFGGLGLITVVDPSVGDCRFPVGLRTSGSSSQYMISFLWCLVLVARIFSRI